MDANRKIVTSKGNEYEATFLNPPRSGNDIISFGIASEIRPSELAQELDNLEWFDFTWYSELPERYEGYTKLIYLDCTESWRISVSLTKESK